MPRILLTIIVALTLVAPAIAEPKPSDQQQAIDYLKARGVRIQLDENGNAVSLMSSGKPAMTADDYQVIGLLVHLQRMGLNGAPLDDQQWGFLHKLPKLSQLSIWHGRGFATLKPFCGLPVQSLTIGGCMGLRDKNRDHPERQRDAILTLRDLPNLKRGNWYHSPLMPSDKHLAHIAAQFPTLENLRLDFAAPRASETTITEAGLAALQKLPLTTLTLENAQTFNATHFRAIAGIKTLQVLLIDARRNAVDDQAIDAFRNARPNVPVVVAPPGSERPPTPPRKGKR